MRYFMDVSDGHTVAKDIEGTECPDDEAVREAALKAARALLSESDAKGLCRRHWRFDILNTDREQLFQVPFAHALVPDTLPEHAWPAA